MTVSNRHRYVLFTPGIAADFYHTMQRHRGRCLCEETGDRMLGQLTPGSCINGSEFYFIFILSHHFKDICQEKKKSNESFGI